ncbi:MAG: hypothetical protein WD512_10430 [Candidatus Paceibacterota bacterium]
MEDKSAIIIGIVFTFLIIGLIIGILVWYFVVKKDATTNSEEKPDNKLVITKNGPVIKITEKFLSESFFATPSSRDENGNIYKYHKYTTIKPDLQYKDYAKKIMLRDSGTPSSALNHYVIDSVANLKLYIDNMKFWLNEISLDDIQNFMQKLGNRGKKPEIKDGKLFTVGNDGIIKEVIYYYPGIVLAPDAKYEPTEFPNYLFFYMFANKLAGNKFDIEVESDWIPTTIEDLDNFENKIKNADSSTSTVEKDKSTADKSVATLTLKQSGQEISVKDPNNSTENFSGWDKIENFGGWNKIKNFGGWNNMEKFYDWGTDDQGKKVDFLLKDEDNYSNLSKQRTRIDPNQYKSLPVHINAYYINNINTLNDYIKNAKFWVDKLSIEECKNIMSFYDKYSDLKIEGKNIVATGGKLPGRGDKIFSYINSGNENIEPLSLGAYIVYFMLVSKVSGLDYNIVIGDDLKFESTSNNTNTNTNTTVVV